LKQCHQRSGNISQSGGIQHLFHLVVLFARNNAQCRKLLSGSATCIEFHRECDHLKRNHKTEKRDAEQREKGECLNNQTDKKQDECGVRSKGCQR